MTSQSQFQHDRIQVEREFHNKTFSEGSRERTGRWYMAVRSGEWKQNDRVQTLARNRTVLEYGCADGDLSLHQLRLPSLAKEMHGIDISDYAIAKARLDAADLGYANARFQTMNAEAMSFPDDHFDMIFGRSIIHHLDLEACFSEVSRVLKPGGCALFYEPMGHNPVLNWYRNRTPELRTPDEHPIVERDFVLAHRYFREVRVTCFGLATLAAAAVGSPHLMKGLEGLDRLLFRSRSLRRQAWFVLMEMYK